MLRNVGMAMFTALALSPFISAASAHPQFKAAGPAPGSVVQVAPKAVRIQFSEDLELAFSGIEIRNKTGEVQKTGAASLLPTDKKQLLVPVEGTLAPGMYTVNWHVVGADTHPQKGSFNFEVKP